MGGIMITVMLADDHTLLREGLRRLLEQAGDISVQGEAGNGAEALTLLGQRAWDLLVLDMSMPGRNGVDLIRQIKSGHPDVPILVLTMHGEQQYAIQAIKAGASGFLTKDSAAEELVQAVRKVAGGGRYLSPSLAESIAFERQDKTDALPHLLLSDRELSVFHHLASGLNNSDIARRLFLSVKTVSTYKSRILVKMNLRNQTDLVRYAIRHRLINEQDLPDL
jgi:DNA-binding NarL/FixJ family response regulator